MFGRDGNGTYRHSRPRIPGHTSPGQPLVSPHTLPGCSRFHSCWRHPGKDHWGICMEHISIELWKNDFPKVRLTDGPWAWQLTRQEFDSHWFNFAQSSTRAYGRVYKATFICPNSAGVTLYGSRIWANKSCLFVSCKRGIMRRDN